MMLLREAIDRTLAHFVAHVQDKTIRSALRYYTLEGTLGRLLDAETDSIADAGFLVFEIEDLMAVGERNLIPILLYLFHRFERALTGQPAYLLLDEAWVMLGHPVFRAKIRYRLKVLRKASCAVVLATQSLSDAARSGSLDVPIESCQLRRGESAPTWPGVSAGRRRPGTGCPPDPSAAHARLETHLSLNASALVSHSKRQYDATPSGHGRGRREEPDLRPGRVVFVVETAGPVIMSSPYSALASQHLHA